MNRVKKIRPPAAHHCTFVFGPPKTQTQPPEPPRPSPQLLFRGFLLHFRGRGRIRFNELSPPQESGDNSKSTEGDRRRVTVSMAPRRKAPEPIDQASVKLAFAKIHNSTASVPLGPMTPRPPLRSDFRRVAFEFSPHPTSHFRGVR